METIDRKKLKVSAWLATKGDGRKLKCLIIFMGVVTDEKIQSALSCCFVQQCVDKWGAFWCLVLFHFVDAFYSERNMAAVSQTIISWSYPGQKPKYCWYHKYPHPIFNHQPYLYQTHQTYNQRISFYSLPQGRSAMRSWKRNLADYGWDFRANLDHYSNVDYVTSNILLINDDNDENVDVHV